MKDGQAKVADFGLSRYISLCANSIKGTLCYIAPEMMLDNEYDKSIDIWSLGIMFIESMMDKRISSILPGKAPPYLREEFPTEEILKEMPNDGVRKLIKGMLQKNAKQRMKI
jgi:serine/threonine protein kinase